MPRKARSEQLPPSSGDDNATRMETPLVIPAPVGTFVLHVVMHKGSVMILKHVCIHFERFDDRILPRCMIAAGDNVIEAAVLHPSGHISGSPLAPFTFENVEQFVHNIRQRHKTKPTTRKTEAFERARALMQDEDLVG